MSKSLFIGCLNIEGDRHLERTLPILNEMNFDVLCMQEVIYSSVGRIANALHAYSYFVPMAHVWTKNVSTRNIMGLGLFVRHGECLRYSTHHYYVEGVGLPEINGPCYNCNRVLQYARISKGGVMYGIGQTHFFWTDNGVPDSLQQLHAPRLVDIALREAIVLCGDFNAPRGMATWQIFAERLKDNIPRDVTSTLDPNLHRAAPLEHVVDGLFTPPPYESQNVRLISDLSDHKLIAAEIVRVS